MKSTCALALSFGMAVAANAAQAIVGISSITYTGTAPELTGANLDVEANLINGNGLSEALTVANIDTVTHDNASFSAPGNAWVTTDPGGGGSDFFASSPGTVVFDLVLDATYDIGTFYNWSYDFDEGTGNGNNIKTFTVDYGVGDFTGGTLTDVTFSGTANNVASTADLGGITADRIRITVTDNFFEDHGGGDRVAAAEFAFVTSAAVPEPSSAALLGLGGLALILRRRK